MKLYTSIEIIPQKVLDQDTGEIHTQYLEKQRIPKKIRGGYRMVYEAYDQALINTVTSSTDLMIITYIRDMYTYNQKENHLSAAEIASCFDVSPRKVEMLIKKLVETKLLGRVRRGVYRLNPYMYIPFRANAEELQAEWNSL